MGRVAEVPSGDSHWPHYLAAWVHDLEGDGELTTSFTHYGDSDDFDVAGLRAHAARIATFARQVLLTADELDAGGGRLGADPESAQERRTWTIAFEEGGNISGYLPPWIERSSTDDYTEKKLRADRLGLLVDIDHWLSVEGVEMNVTGPGFDDPAEPEELFRGHLQVRPFDKEPGARVPHVDLEVVEGRWMQNLVPADLAGISDKLRLQAERLDNLRAQLVCARADWEANACPTREAGQEDRSSSARCGVL
ncbi:hypothetical protein RM572_15730 [Streptomyces sp. DSM 42041]|uniref:Uncharacterized protein n=1 Tax=Streptomyces hazeniae TaxID=3075538 RepID=A0ABU2NTW9_9ACTN|nr:hypothetical protein [Streptomyces sp. DSM 42041]MDT0380209.1 hypothetical protein [Streptomyces sp. DSM 42041]